MENWNENHHTHSGLIGVLPFQMGRLQPRGPINPEMTIAGLLC